MKSDVCGAAALAALLFAQLGVAQSSPLAIAWQRSFGGSANDVLAGVRMTADGGSLLAGTSSSANGTRTSPTFGAEDFWLVRVNQTGAVVWDKSLGGLGADQLYGLEITRSNRFILVGGSDSPVSGSKTVSSFGLRDFWVVLVDGTGQKLWDRSFGGSDDDYATCVIETEDGGFLVGGYSRSQPGGTGNKTAPLRGEGDIWLVRLDAAGNKLQDWSYGGSGDDGAFSLVSLSGGSVIVAGNSTSPPSGNKDTPNYGGYDLWLLRLRGDGAVEWQRDYGGDLDDGYYNVALARAPDGGFIVGGDSFSGSSGNKTSSNQGLDDYWILRLDSAGLRMWETNCGGAANDYLTSLIVTSDGGFLAGGGSNSDVGGSRTSPNLGVTDFWLVQLNANGSVLWDDAIGGTDADAFFSLSLAQGADGSVFCAGDSISDLGGDKTTAGLGLYDYWLVKLATAVAPPRLLVSLVGSAPQIVLQAQSGRTYVTEASLDLQTWAPVMTNQLSGTQQVITDPGQTGRPRRFYRARLAP